MTVKYLSGETSGAWVRVAVFLASAAVISTAADRARAGDPVTSVEGCIGCHAVGAEAPVGNIADPKDMHWVDLHPAGPATPSSYRELNVTLSAVDVSGSNIVIDFSVTDENGTDVENVFDTDGRFVLAKLVDGEISGMVETAGNPTEWQRLVQERFTEGGTFVHVSGASYRFTTIFDPTTIPIAQGDTLRGALQISASDIPAGNGWCDFEADLASANDCTTTPTLTRDIVQTDTCNGCHGTTSDTKLSFHGGGRTEVEYCVTCHNPDRNPDTAMTTMTHKIHYGSELTQEYLGGDYEHVTFTRDIDDCTSCHEQGGADELNWMTEANRESCGSCHDDVDFDTGDNHPSAGPQPNNRFCSNCHPAAGPITPSELPVATVHQGVARAEEGDLYRGEGNGFIFDSVTYDRSAKTLTVDYSVVRGGDKMILQSDPRWSNGARLELVVAWSTENYTNEGSLSSPAPAQPASVSALDVGGAITDRGEGDYRAVIDVSSFGFGNLTVGTDGHPVADVLGVGSYTNIALQNVFRHVSVEPRVPHPPRRGVVDIAKCNACHDADGAGLSLHGSNRSGEMQVCVLCHNSDATDIRQRPMDPGMTADGKREEGIDIKRMVHQIHMGGDLEMPVVIYGFGGNEHDYSTVEFLGNNRNCLTCHEPGTYSADAAWRTLPTTVDTGDEVTDPSDDMNISPVSAVCSSCHDSARAKEHMISNGATFSSLEENIAIASVPEPAGSSLAAAMLGALAALASRRRRYT